MARLSLALWRPLGQKGWDTLLLASFTGILLPGAFAAALAALNPLFAWLGAGHGAQPAWLLGLEIAVAALAVGAMASLLLAGPPSPWAMLSVLSGPVSLAWPPQARDFEDFEELLAAQPWLVDFVAAHGLTAEAFVRLPYASLFWLTRCAAAARGSPPRRPATGMPSGTPFQSSADLAAALRLARFMDDLRHARAQDRRLSCNKPASAPASHRRRA